MKFSNARLISPISHARANNAQRARAVFSQYTELLAPFIEEPTNDVDIVFTTGLYLNNQSDAPLKQRLNLIQREAEWRIQFSRILDQNASSCRVGAFDLIPSAFTYVNWDDHLNKHWNAFFDFYQKLQKFYGHDSHFKKAVDQDIFRGGRGISDNTLRFLFEEIAVTAMWLKGFSLTIRRLRQTDREDNLYIAYPGAPMESMLVGLDLILKNNRDALPLVWIDTSATVKVSTFRFGTGKDFFIATSALH